MPGWQRKKICLPMISEVCDALEDFERVAVFFYVSRQILGITVQSSGVIVQLPVIPVFSLNKREEM